MSVAANNNIIDMSINNIAVTRMREFAVKNDLRKYITDPVGQAAFLAIVEKESNFTPRAKNRTSSAFGFLQMLASTYHKNLRNILNWYEDVGEPVRQRFRELGALNVDPRYHSELTRQRVLSDPIAVMLIFNALAKYYTKEIVRVAGDVQFDDEVQLGRCLNLFHHDWQGAVNILRRGSGASVDGVITSKSLSAAVYDFNGHPLVADDKKMTSYMRLAVQARDSYLSYVNG